MKMRNYILSPTNKSKNSIFLVLMAILPNFVALSTSSSSSSPLAPALFVFGDSLFDSGNNNLLPTLARANYLPYGKDFPKGVTGRFTHGKTVADFIAEYLRLPYSPSYWDVRGQGALKGMNFASGSCGILPETGSQYGICFNIEDQIELFNNTVDKELQPLFESDDELSNYLSKSIFIFSIGSNDYLGNYRTVSAAENKNTFAQRLVDKLALQFQKLYDLGARKVIMFEVGPIGCVPSVTRKENDGTQCVEEANRLVKYFNGLLGTKLNQLTATLQGSNFVLARAHWLGYDAIQNPTDYDLTDGKNPCCTTWNNGTSGCIPLLPACRDANRHFFWDAYHLTQSVCSVIASRCINDSSVCSPSISELAQM